MFLIQGADGSAILYTGDTRSETWLVNSLVQNPVLLPYTLGSKRLDCLYLDTTFATKSEINRHFPSKAQGLRELLEKVGVYPKDTVFYFHSWTFGYENVWIALSAALGSQVHLDNYRWRLYKSLRPKKCNPSQTDKNTICQANLPQPRESAALCGYEFGNHETPGCLTTDATARIHSCEKGAHCSVIDDATKVVHITPIISRTSSGIEVAEVGAGGGQGDLDQIHELEFGDLQSITQLMAICASKIQNEEVLSKVLSLLTSSINGQGGRLRLDLSDMVDEDASDNIPLDKITEILRSVTGPPVVPNIRPNTATLSSTALPRSITFPYSRHSSYSELRELVAVFKPRDIHPCTVDETGWTEAGSMRTLFGDLCSDNIFAHDHSMLEKMRDRHERINAKKQRLASSQLTEDPDATDDEDTNRKVVDMRNRVLDSAKLPQEHDSDATESESDSVVFLSAQTHPQLPSEAVAQLRHPASPLERPISIGSSPATSFQATQPERPRSIQKWAYDAAAELRGADWSSFGGLQCTKERSDEEELGSPTS